MYSTLTIFVPLLLLVFALRTACAFEAVNIDPNGRRFFANDPRLRKEYLRCACSAGLRGAASPVRTAMREYKSFVEKELQRLQNAGASKDFARKSLEANVLARFGQCERAHGVEACINADAESRSNVAFCTYDSATGKNVAPFRLNDGSIQYFTLVLCSSNTTLASPLSSLRCTPDIKGECKSMNEGCVAVEHLKGYVLQHPRPLRRHVLCYNGFCATPNHAIIVDGKMTSMKRMCSTQASWNCYSDIKWVNNLKISANTRAVFNDHITITPYDLRFPVPLIWAVQMTQDALQLVLLSVYVSVAITAALYAYLNIYDRAPDRTKLSLVKSHSHTHRPHRGNSCASTLNGKSHGRTCMQSTVIGMDSMRLVRQEA